MGRIFGTDGARGVAGTELTVQLAMDIGRAAAMVAGKKTGKRPLVAIGKDTRLSGDMLESAVAAGLCSVGADVLLLGVLPTPAVAYLVKRYQADAGIMLSASHNPAAYNGIKIFGPEGFKLTDAQEEEIEGIILDHTMDYPQLSGEDLGRVRRVEQAHTDYVAHLASTVGEKLTGLRVVVDCANGSASATARELMEALGVTADFICDAPDGYNINENCGSTHIENLTQVVRQGNYDLGVAFDGDADRCLAVDEQGELVDGDMLLAIFGQWMQKTGTLQKDCIVATVMSNLGFFRFAGQAGLRTEQTKVGDRYVLEKMLEQGYNLGGEQSGHVIFLDYMTTGDGQLSAVQLMKILYHSGEKLSSLRSVMKKYPQVLLGVQATPQRKSALGESVPVQEAIAHHTQLLGDRGRILVRVSGTEPLIRVMVEGEDKTEIQGVAQAIAHTIEENLPQ